MSGRYEVGVHEKAVASLESLLFAKYQMFRNVYWHHGVRAATALYKRIVEEAVEGRVGHPFGVWWDRPTRSFSTRSVEGRRGWIRAGRSDSEPAGFRLSGVAESRRGRSNSRLRTSLRSPFPPGSGTDSPRRRTLEDRLAKDLDLEPGEVVVDYPAKAAMFQLNLLLERRNGEVARVGPEGLPGVIDLPRVAEELYRTARVLRVFTFLRRTVTRDAFLTASSGD